MNRECLRCHKTRPHHGRGLCVNCYDLAQQSGTLGTWPSRRRSTMPAVAELVNEGLNRRQIADRLGMSLNAVDLARKRAAAAGLIKPRRDTGPRALPAEPTPCADADPALFTITSANGGGMSRQERDQVMDALSYCERCPLASREWCLDVVAPAGSRFSGVVGGQVWIKGHRAPAAVSA